MIHGMKRKGGRPAGLTALLLVLIILMMIALTAGCSAIPERSAPAEPDEPGSREPEEDWNSGMIEVDVGDGETRWIRAYDDVPVSTLKADEFEAEDGFIRYKGTEYTAMQGIDVSTFQGEIDWPAVAADGIEFAMIRIGGRGYSQGAIYEDDRFAENLRGAADSGIRAGVYFFSQAVTPEEAEEEAEFILSILAELPEGSVTMPVAFDWEMVHEEDSRTAWMDGETLTSCASAFCAKIAEAGYEPIVYAYRYLAYEMYDLSALAPYPLWISTLDASPDFYYAFEMWQYTEDGAVDGIQSRVDLNLRFVPAGQESAAEAEAVPAGETEETSETEPAGEPETGSGEELPEDGAPAEGE